MAQRPPLPALTGLRFVAAAQVVGFHLHAIIPSFRETPLLTFLGAGYSGVSLFFVLSGFVLTYNYLEPDGRGVASIRDFLVARAARIYAVYFVGIVLGMPIFIRELQHAGGIDRIFRDGLPVTLANLTLLQSWFPQYACRLNCPGWSLSTEAFFYLVFPFIGALFCREKKNGLLVALVGCCAVTYAMVYGYVSLDPDGVGIATAATDATWLNVLKFNPIVRLPEFTLGIALGMLFLRAPNALGRHAAWLSIAAVAIIAVSLSLHLRVPYALMHNGFLLPAYALLIFTLAGGQGRLAGMLSTKRMHLLGEASFALYLLHVSLLSYVIKALSLLGLSIERTPALVIIYLVVAQGVSILVLQRIEEPARKAIRRRLSRARNVVAA
jgi:peptidoglycan/LPS O-acetylase OafA/YrhL